MEIVLTKADGPGTRDRVRLVSGGRAWIAPVHAVHDLLHLVVESLFDLSDGLWGELARGHHPEASRAASARDAKLQKKGRIVSGAASGAETDEWLSERHQLSKSITNAVANRWGDGPDTPAGVRDRLARDASPGPTGFVAGMSDETLAAAIHGVRGLLRLWVETPPGAVLKLQWPLPRSFLDSLPGEP